MKKMVQAAVFCALIAVSSWLAIPLPGVALTLQTLAIALCGYCLSWKYALAAVAAYLTLGGFGLPVFSNFSGGIGWLVGPGGGYLFGFLLLGTTCGLPLKKRRRKVAAGMAGAVALHLCGAGWYAYSTHQTFAQALLVASAPFIVKDLLCVWLAEFAANKMGIFKKRT